MSAALGTFQNTASLEEVKIRLNFFKKLQALTNKIHATHNVDEIMLDMSQDICELFNCDRLTIYAIGEDKASIVSKVKTGLNSVNQLKLPISDRSIAGYAALSGKILNIKDVYDDVELKSHSPALRFLREVDRRTGFRTRQMLVAPFAYEPFKPDRIKSVDLLKNLRREFVEQSQWLPIEDGKDGLVILATDPEQVKNTWMINTIFPKIRLSYRVTTNSEFRQTVEQFFGIGGDRWATCSRGWKRTMRMAPRFQTPTSRLRPKTSWSSWLTKSLSMPTGRVPQTELRNTATFMKDPDGAQQAVLEAWTEKYANAEGRFTLYRAVGCDQCSGGYKARVGLHELMLGSDKLKRLIQEHSRVAVLLAAALEDGMLTLKMDGIEKVLSGITDIKQVRAVCIK
jgi:hypothetical protein